MGRKNKNAEKQQLTPVYILGAVTALALIVMTVALLAPPKQTVGEFVPPAFESAAVRGVPKVPEELGYSSPYREGMVYRFSVCANVTVEDGLALVYFTSNEENDVYLKLRILDDCGNILGESGLLKPGEYVKDVTLCGELSPGTKISLKIMSYEPETYMSEGSVVLNTVIG